MMGDGVQFTHILHVSTTILNIDQNPQALPGSVTRWSRHVSVICRTYSVGLSNTLPTIDISTFIIITTATYLNTAVGLGNRQLATRFRNPKKYNLHFFTVKT